jgi:transcriptional regulator with XRE-family HTH domain
MVLTPRVVSHEGMSKPVAVLKHVRERLGLTQTALAHRLGVVPRTVSRWERGITEVPEDVVPRALALLRARDPEAASRIAIEAKLPGAPAQEEARRAALDHAVYAAADALDVSPRRAREVLSVFLTHLVAAGIGAADARARLAEKIGGARDGGVRAADGDSRGGAQAGETAGAGAKESGR